MALIYISAICNLLKNKVKNISQNHELETCLHAMHACMQSLSCSQIIGAFIRDKTVRPSLYIICRWDEPVCRERCQYVVIVIHGNNR